MQQCKDCLLEAVQEDPIFKDLLEDTQEVWSHKGPKSYRTQWVIHQGLAPTPW